MNTETTAGFFLSPQQSYLWQVQQTLQKIPLTQIAVLLQGQIDATQLEASMQTLVERHEILRTVFRRKSGMKLPFQVVLDDPRFQWSEATGASEDALAEAGLALRRQASSPIDLENGPLLQAALIRLDNAHLLALTLPALCADAVSMTNLIRETAAIYRKLVGRQAPGESDVAEPLRYVQFAQWQTEQLESTDEAATEARTSWMHESLLGPATTLHPFGAVPPQNAPGLSDRSEVTGTLSADVVARLDAFTTEAQVSTAAVLLTALHALAFRLSANLQPLLGVVLDGRNYDELSDAIGLFSKTVPVPAQFAGGVHFREAARQVHQALETSAERQEYLDPASAFPAETAQHAPIGFSYNDLGEHHLAGDLRLQPLDLRFEAQIFQLELDCIRSGNELRLRFHFDPGVFVSEKIEAFAAYFQNLLASALDRPATAVAHLPFLPEAERDQILFGWNRNAAPHPFQTVHSLFEDQANRTPKRNALRCMDETLTYEQLNARANQLAHHLRELGVGPGHLAGLCVDRSVAMMVGVLAILKAGAAYVPLAIDLPTARLQQQLAGVSVLLTEQRLLAQLPALFGEAPAGNILSLDSDLALWQHQPSTPVESGVTPDDLAYVIYTSGSTGVPKGVEVRHRNLVNYVWAISKHLSLADHPEGLTFATVSTLAADLGNTCIYPALLSGGTLQIVPYHVAINALQMADHQKNYPADVLKIVPSHLAALLDSPDAAKILPRRYLITGGEALSGSLIATIGAAHSTCKVINHYGPTETTIGSLAQPLDGFDWKRTGAATVPIGRPLANTHAYVLDDSLQPVPEGVAGQLYIAGAGVAAGYRNRPDLTAAGFLPNPFVPGEIMYRTGDLVRHLPFTGGCIEFLRRVDDQIKIRGFRIEPAEVEAVLLRLPPVRQAIVLASRDPAGGQQLMGYVVAHRNGSVSGGELRTQLQQLLPDYMVPAAIVLLDKLPLTANGKIDRVALVAAGQSVAAPPYLPPGTPTEEGVALIWAALLHRPQISRDANFFHLGGHSLMATQVISRIREQFLIEMPLRDLFECPTLQGIAATIDQKRQVRCDAEKPIGRVSRDAYRQIDPTGETTHGQ